MCGKMNISDAAAASAAAPAVAAVAASSSPPGSLAAKLLLPPPSSSPSTSSSSCASPSCAAAAADDSSGTNDDCRGRPLSPFMAAPSMPPPTLLPVPRLPPLRVLSVLWLILCATLVSKHNDLVSVFFSFVGSFVAAGLVEFVSRRSRRRRRRKGSLLKRSVVKDMVGLLACSYALVALGCGSISFPGVAPGIAPEDGDDGREIYSALSVAAGYLAFDLWYGPLLCEPPALRTSPWEVWENALTLTAFVVILARFGVEGGGGGEKERGLSAFRTHVAAWAGYKCVRLGLALATSMTRTATGTVRTPRSGGGCCCGGKEAVSALSSSSSSSSSVAKREQERAAMCHVSVKPSLSPPRSPSQPPRKDIHERSLTTKATTTNNTSTSTTSTTSLLWTIHGQSYDLSSFVDRHPGGREALLLGRGRDCTALFESYHPFTSRHREVLGKYVAVEAVEERARGGGGGGGKHSHGAGAATFAGAKEDAAGGGKGKGGDGTRKEEEAALPSAAASAVGAGTDPFYDTLKDRAHAALLRHGIEPIHDRAASPLRCLYYALVLISLLYSLHLHLHANILGSISLSIFGWLIGSLGHDGGHYAAFRSPYLNSMSVWGMSLLCNPIMWQHQHTYAHHSHTNEYDRDPDLHHFNALLRVHRKFRRERVHGYQSNILWVVFAYTFVVFGTCVKMPWGMMDTGTLYGMVEWMEWRGGSGRGRGGRCGRAMMAMFAMVAHYILYIGVIMGGPLILSGRAWYIGLVCAVMHVALSGLLFAAFSQINHLNEDSLEGDAAEMHNDDAKVTGCSDLVRTSWAARQIITSNNFCPSSPLWHVLSNGLNLQIEHHLFPGLNHAHLHVIQPVVCSTCEEFGVPYKCYGSWGELMGATLRWLDGLSQEEEEEAGEKEKGEGEEGRRRKKQQKDEGVDTVVGGVGK